MRIAGIFLLALGLVVGCGDDTPPTNIVDAGSQTSEDAGDTTPDTACEPACGDQQCGIDPVCGESCGTCADGESCDEGMCVCVPVCDGRSCGPDGCGGTCGGCADGEMCNEMTGVCAVTCEPATCADLMFECGMRDDGCGGTVDCSMCAAGACVDGVCENTAPSFNFTSPAGADPFYAIDEFVLAWTDDDPEDDATIELYWDDDNQGADGTLIEAGLSEDDPANSYTWDLSGLPEGIYWPYAVIDDGAGPLTVYASAPVIKPVTCRPATSGTFEVDIQTVDIAIDISRDGVPVSPMNTGVGEGHGIITLRRVLDNSVGARVSTSDTLPRTVPVLPGVYDVLYTRAEGPNWPAGTDIVLQKGVPITASGSLSIDVPTETLTVDITIDGVDPKTVDSNFQWPALTLIGSGGGFIRTVSAASLPVSITVVPGTYTVDIKPFGAFGGSMATTMLLPTTLGQASSGQVNNLDIVTAVQEIDFTFNGAPLGDPSVDPAGYVTLINEAQPRSGLTLATQQTPLQVRVPQGVYRLVNDRGSNGWPKDRAILRDNIQVGSSPITVDVLSETVQLDVMVDGVSGVDLNQTIRLFPGPPSDSTLASSVQLSLPTGSTQVNLTPGTYHVVYSATQFSGVNTPFGFADLGSFDTSTGAGTFDVRSHPVALNPTYIGQTTGTETASFFVAPPRSWGEMRQQPADIAGGLASMDTSTPVDVVEGPNELFIGLGSSPVVPLGRSLNVSAPITDSFDVELSTVDISLLFNGTPISDSNLGNQPLPIFLFSWYPGDEYYAATYADRTLLGADATGSVGPITVQYLAGRKLVVVLLNRDIGGVSDLPYTDGIRPYIGTPLGCVDMTP